MRSFRDVVASISSNLSRENLYTVPTKIKGAYLSIREDCTARSSKIKVNFSKLSEKTNDNLKSIKQKSGNLFNQIKNRQNKFTKMQTELTEMEDKFTKMQKQYKNNLNYLSSQLSVPDNDDALVKNNVKKIYEHISLNEKSNKELYALSDPLSPQEILEGIFGKLEKEDVINLSQGIIPEKIIGKYTNIQNKAFIVEIAWTLSQQTN